METSANIAQIPAKRAPVGPVQQQPLPRSVVQLLEWLDPKDYRKVETMVCMMPSTRELILVARFLDAIWNQARNAEFRIGASRITGAEMDGFYDRWKAALGELTQIGIELGRRTGLTEIMQRHKTVLAHFGYDTSGRPLGGERPSAQPKSAKPIAALAVSA
jgi:hypothetical protein